MSPPVFQSAGNSGRGAKPGRAGFTLLEVLIAIGISAALLVAANFFFLSMGELWGRGSETRLFDQHVRGVTRFLESFLAQAVAPTESTQTSGAGTSSRSRQSSSLNQRGRHYSTGEWAAADRPVVRFASFRGGATAFLAQTGSTSGRGTTTTGKTTPGSGTTRKSGGSSTGVTSSDTSTTERFSFGTPVGYENTTSLLMFEVDQAPGVCVWPGRPLPQVQCALQVTADEGLMLLWKSRLEEDFDTARPRKTLLSPFVQAIWYEYYDSDRGEWTRTEEPQVDSSRQLVVPQRFRLLFEYQNERREVSIALPGSLEGPPLR